MNTNASEHDATGAPSGAPQGVPVLTGAPPGVPVVDVDPFSDDFLTDPYPDHERMREAGAIVWIPKYRIYASARHAEVRTILNDHATYISSAGVGLADFNKETPFRPRSLILEADPPDHTRARSVLARILSPKTVMQVRATFAAEADSLLDRLMEKANDDGEVDVIKEIAEVYPLKVFPDAVGLESEGREMLLLYGNMIFNAFGPRNELLRRAAEKVEPVTQWIMDHCRRDMLRPGGFGDMIYQAADAGEISLQEAPLLVRSFLSAGVDTTVNGIGNALLCLAQHPEQYARLHRDPSLARGAFEEALRFESAVQTFFRPPPSMQTSRGSPFPPAARFSPFSPRPTAMRGNGRSRTGSTSSAARPDTWPSAPASTDASDRWWRDWRAN
jgi:cytochrome P450